MTESHSDQDNSRSPGTLAGNLGEPVKLAGLQLNSITAEAARRGETLKVWTRLSLTSDDHLFHRTAESFTDHIEHMARQAGFSVDLKRSDVILLVVHPDDTGDLWLDTAARRSRRSWNLRWHRPRRRQGSRTRYYFPPRSPIT